MTLLRHTTPSVHLTLSRDLTRTLRRGHPWVFADALRERPPAPAGSLALLNDPRGRPLALGIYDPHPTLSFRVCRILSGSRGEALELGDGWAEEHLARALRLRQALLPEDTTGYRLLNGEGDGLPGLVVDIYADSAVIRLDGGGPSGFWNIPGLAGWARRALNLRCVVERARGETGGCVVAGTAPTAPVAFLENGAWFTADVLHGQKTGFFLDQRDNRARVRGLAAGRRVLNLFGYTGGFSIYAGLGGAAHIVTVDSAAPALEEAERHWQLNGLPHRGHSIVAADAFEFLERANAEGRRWELVIADPPAFAQNQAGVPAALAAYRRLAGACAAATATEGWLCLASCSSHISQADFLSACAAGLGGAGRRAAVLGIHGQPFDHPTPLAMPEFRYLKFVLLRVE
jgi:23S rRNA (cytosine1962-C5)-methyltransferase